MDDGIHFNKGGYQILYVELKNAIKTAYPELDAQAMPWLFPRHEDILPSKDIKKALQDWKPKVS
jgi:hypothetical protein